MFKIFQGAQKQVNGWLKMVCGKENELRSFPNWICTFLPRTFGDIFTPVVRREVAGEIAQELMDVNHKGLYQRKTLRDHPGGKFYIILQRRHRSYIQLFVLRNWGFYSDVGVFSENLFLENKQQTRKLCIDTSTVNSTAYEQKMIIKGQPLFYGG